MSRPCSDCHALTLVSASLAWLPLPSAGHCRLRHQSGHRRPGLVFTSEAGDRDVARKCTRMILQQYGGATTTSSCRRTSTKSASAPPRSHRPEMQYTFTVLDSEEINAFALPAAATSTSRAASWTTSTPRPSSRPCSATRSATSPRAIRCASRASRPRPASAPAAVGILTGSGDLADLANFAGAALVSGYGRDMELEADRLGAEYWRTTGYAPEAHDRRRAAAQEPGDVRDRSGRARRIASRTSITASSRPTPTTTRGCSEVVAAAGQGRRRSR